MAEVKRPFDKKIEGKVPPVDAKDGTDATETGEQPDDDKKETK